MLALAEVTGPSWWVDQLGAWSARNSYAAVLLLVLVLKCISSAYEISIADELRRKPMGRSLVLYLGFAHATRC